MIGPEGVKDLKLPKSLTSLALGYNGIGDEGARDLKLPPSLTSLNLYLNNIGPQALRDIEERYPKVDISTRRLI